jgi:hypothetical protein
MALPTNAFATYEAIGNREDLSNIIYRIDPTDTPFMSGIARETASAVNHEWQTQALAAAVTTNYQLEGDDIVADAATPTVRLGNVCQISRKSAQVSGTQQSVIHAGRGNELDYQVMLKGMELKRDMESTLVGSNQAKATGSDAVVRKTASLCPGSSRTPPRARRAARPTRLRLTARAPVPMARRLRSLRRV